MNDTTALGAQRPQTPGRLPEGGRWKRWVDLAAALALALVALALSARVLGLHRGRFDVPLAYWGDALNYQMLVQGMLDNGWYLDNPKLGWPHGQDYRAFP